MTAAMGFVGGSVFIQGLHEKARDIQVEKVENMVAAQITGNVQDETASPESHAYEMQTGNKILMKVSVQGPMVYAENRRFRYSFKIGQEVEPQGNGAKDTEKRVVTDLMSSATGMYSVAIRPAADARGRVRVLPIDSFCSRYLVGQKIVQNTQKALAERKRKKGVKNALHRIEAKLDLIMSSLQLKYEEKDDG